MSLNHAKGTPQHQKFILAQKFFKVQEILGRPFKKYNLLITQDDGDWFSSEDDLSEGFINSVLKKRERQYKDGCNNWNIMYAMKSRGLKDNQRFFCYCNLSNDRDGDYGKIDKFEYFTWKQQL
tara:strand:+ start:191 stop:559 length:369 start_codon:yes stop_codon:yes gene_type:complete